MNTCFGQPQVPGHAPSQLNFPWSLCYHGSLLYVGDKYNLRVLVLSPSEATTVRVLSDEWPWAARFAPRGFASSPDGSIFMTNSFGGTVWRYEPLGAEESEAVGESESKRPVPEKVAGSGIRSYRDGRSEFAEFRFPAGIATDRDGSLLIADHGNHVLRRLRTLREAEVKAKLRKMLADLNNRGARVCYQRWAMNVAVHEPLEPYEVVLTLALATLSSGVASLDSPFTAFRSQVPPDAPSSEPGAGGADGASPLTNEAQALRSVVQALARSLEWRVVKTRQEVSTAESAADGDAPSAAAGMTEEELAERMAEAREVFDKFDADGSGSIDASELKEALDAADVDVSPEEVLELLATYDSKSTGEVHFEDFCRMQGIPLPMAEADPDEAAVAADESAKERKPKTRYRWPHSCRSGIQATCASACASASGAAAARVARFFSHIVWFWIVPFSSFLSCPASPRAAIRMARPRPPGAPRAQQQARAALLHHLLPSWPPPALSLQKVARNAHSERFVYACSVSEQREADAKCLWGAVVLPCALQSSATCSSR